MSWHRRCDRRAGIAPNETVVRPRRGDSSIFRRHADYTTQLCQLYRATMVDRNELRVPSASRLDETFGPVSVVGRGGMIAS